MVLFSHTCDIVGESKCRACEQLNDKKEVKAKPIDEEIRDAILDLKYDIKEKYYENRDGPIEKQSDEVINVFDYCYIMAMRSAVFELTEEYIKRYNIEIGDKNEKLQKNI